ncbi:MAG TPA: adenosine deaminase [Gammaproteobacteria bacterium]|nr:adenosine deaminase [Gammaproteobacteria bacterium]
MDPLFIKNLPKAELHVHIEGTLEPELLLKLAEKNKIQLPFTSIEAVKQQYQFENLQDFLDLYYMGTQVLQTAEDFFTLTAEYLTRAHQNGITHCEIFFDPQSHTQRGIPFAAVFEGIYQALQEGEKKYQLSSHLILCFLRHLSQAHAFATLKEANPFKPWIIGVGLDSSEKNNPPRKFQEVFKSARQAGYKVVAHAGEEGPADYIWQSITLLKAERIDHGVRCLEDPQLVRFLADNRIPLTVCPLSNVKLKIFPTLCQHNLPQLLEQQLCISIHSDDPAYFGGYINDNFQAVAQTFSLSNAQLIGFAKNSFLASFLCDTEKKQALASIDSFMRMTTLTG